MLLQTILTLLEPSASSQREDVLFRSTVTSVVSVMQLS